MSTMFWFVLVIGFFLGIIGVHIKAYVMNKELQHLESVCRDIYTWIQGLPWHYAPYVALGVLLFIFFVASWFIRKEHIDKTNDEGSGWPLSTDIITLWYTLYYPV